MGVLACGLATVDVVHTVAAPPGANQKVTASATRVAAGGPALGAAVTASLLGSGATLVTAVGTGPLAAIVRADLDRYAVRLHDCAAVGFEPPMSTVLVTESTGERAVVSRNAAGTRAYAPLPEGLLEAVTAVLVDGHHLPLCLDVARAARERGIPVVLDGGSWKPGLEALLADVDVAVVSADCHAPGGDGLDVLLRHGPAFAARSRGEGTLTWLAHDGSSGTIEPHRVEVVDTAGAGDVLHGAVLAHIGTHGAEQVADIVAALTLGTDVASRSVQHQGPHGWWAARPA